MLYGVKRLVHNLFCQYWLVEAEAETGFYDEVYIYVR